MKILNDIAWIEYNFNWIKFNQIQENSIQFRLLIEFKYIELNTITFYSTFDKVNVFIEIELNWTQ